ncbi:transporter substrate-binding domain-containing protein [Clostridium minihomine]|uniref:transporter substrate-binding domain-containing protein n=1 Tax=Clostridium minihomine TaxID=2045012 RepID=UPI000C75A081|nr:transporter substrate-binding domain-containing protein [Clostridium minihomine]
MKKLLSLVLACLLCFGITACNQGNHSSSSGTETDESWKKIEQSGTLIVGTDGTFPPMGYTDENGELVGFDIDVAKEAGKYLGVDIKFQIIDWAKKEEVLDNYEVDVLWNGFSKTPESARNFSMSIPYLSSNQAILVKGNSTYYSLKDLSGATIGVQNNSSAKYALNSTQNRDFKHSLKKIVEIESYPEATTQVEKGMIDAIAIDEVSARFFMNNQPGTFRMLDEGGTPISLADEDYVIGMRKNDEALTEKMNEVLMKLEKNGTLKDISYKWFGEDITTVERS